MKNVKNVISLLVVVVLVFSTMLTGCAGKEEVKESVGETAKTEETANESSKEESVEEVVEAEELEEVELIWYFVGSPQAEEQMVYEAANKIIKEKLNATVEFNLIDWGSYNDKMQVMLSTGEPMDLCFTSNWINNYAQNVAKDAFLPLDDLLVEYAPTLEASVPDSFWDATRYQGDIYGIINQQISAMTKGFVVNQNLADKYDMDLSSINTLRDLEPLFETIKANESNDVVGLYLQSGGGGQLLQTIAAYDMVAGDNIPVVVKVSDGSLEVVNKWETDEYNELITLMRDWYVKGYINEDNLTSSGGDESKFMADKALLMTIGNSKPGGDAEMSQKYGTPTVQLPIGDTVLYTSSIISTMHAIPTTSANPERAMMFMELLHTDKELYNLLAFGIEGTHFNKVGENRIEIVEDSKYNPGIPWEIASTFNAYLLPGQEDSVWEETKEVNANAIPSPLLGFSLDMTNITSEIAQVASVTTEYAAALLSGALETDEILPQAKEKLEAAGIQTIIDEVQSQIDAWNAAK